MMSASVPSHHTSLRAALVVADSAATAPVLLQGLVQNGLDRLPQPGGGATLARWQARNAARWIDDHRGQDAAVALRVRLAAEGCATRVLDKAGRALGAAAFCRDAHFARMAADLAAFVRRSHAERDFAALAQHVLAAEGGNWDL